LLYLYFIFIILHLHFIKTKKLNPAHATEILICHLKIFQSTIIFYFWLYEILNIFWIYMPIENIILKLKNKWYISLFLAHDNSTVLRDWLSIYKACIYYLQDLLKFTLRMLQMFENKFSQISDGLTSYVWNFKLWSDKTEPMLILQC
jgi:hypothetical protein